MELHHSSNFKDKMGRWRTQSLFWEWLEAKKRPGVDPLYSLKDYDVTYQVLSTRIGVTELSPDSTDPAFRTVTCRSLKRLYLEEADPTEWTVAEKYFGGFAHWEVLCGLSWFQEWLEPVRHELEIKLRSAALKSLVEQAADGTVSAAKYLASGQYKLDLSKGRPRGRPTRGEVEAEKQKQAQIGENVQDDIDRLGLADLDAPPVTH